MNTNLKINNQQQTMSSLEIAELVESRHDKVKQSIERLAERGVIELPPVGGIKTATKPVSIYLVCKRDSFIVVAQLSPEFTARLVDRWQELENAIHPVLPDFTNPAIAARAWADEVEQKMIAQSKLSEASAKIEADKPKVDFAMAVRNLDGSCLIGEFAQSMGGGRNRLYRDLRERKLLQVNNRPYQRYVDNGIFVVVEASPFTDRQGKTHPSFTTRITGKGQVYLEKLLRHDVAESVN